MNSNTIFLLLALVSVIVGVYILFALSRDGWRRVAGPAFATFVLLILCGATICAMGLPRPLWTFYVDTSSYRLVGYTYEEKKAIYVWLAPENNGDPVVVQLPWSEEKADQLRAAVQQLADNGQDGSVQIGDVARGKQGALVTPKAYPPTTRVKQGH